ncbi:zinc finger SWIM domain-containing protein 3-like [Branchiostoma lanceolatum]|uniref:zinc finger SWIM domain-containing protein 3-like n=1 Tax=Branchiostoma lanceolatum TaxID=7740 RepID=UPI003453C004
MDEVIQDNEDMAEAAATKLKVGATFDSYAEVQFAIHAYQTRNFVQLYIRDSRTFCNAARRAANKNVNPWLKYKEINFACVHGGRKYKSHSSGVRPNQKTFLMDCPVSLKMRMTPDGQSLIVKSFQEQHNHSISKVSFLSLPQRRKEPPPVLISNLNKTDSNAPAAHVQASKPTPPVDIGRVVETMRKIPGATVHVKTSTTEQNKTLSSIFFQTAHMKNLFQAFPDVLLIDATMKQNETNIPLYLLMIIDSNGELHIAGLFMALLEDSATTVHFISSFKASNPNHTRTECIVADAGMPHRDLLAVHFPNVTMSMSELHTLRAFRREVSTEKLGISPDQKTACLQTMEKMVSAQSKEEYDEYYNILQFLDIPQVLVYFNDNWHGKKEEWVTGLRSEHKHFVTTAPKHLEMTIQKVRNIIRKSFSIPTFFIDVMKCIDSLAVEKGQKVVDMVQKVKLIPRSSEAASSEERFGRVLTPHALGLVKQQLQLALSITVIRNVKPAGMLQVKAETCPCGFFRVLKLPCRHIFAARRGKGFDEFDATLCFQRWTRQYYLDHCGMARPQLADTLVDQMRDPPACLDASQQEKYSKAVHLAQRLALAAARLPHHDFVQAVSCLETVASAWERQEQVIVASMDPTPQIQNGTYTSLSSMSVQEARVDEDSCQPPRKKICQD